MAKTIRGFFMSFRQKFVSFVKLVKKMVKKKGHVSTRPSFFNS